MKNLDAPRDTLLAAAQPLRRSATGAGDADADDAVDLDRFFKALSDETRRGILCLLKRRDRTVGEIVSNFHLSQPTISRHLSVLKAARLVSDKRMGQHVLYRLREEDLARSAERFFHRFPSCLGIFERRG